MGSSGEAGRCEHGKLYAEFCWDCVDRSAAMGSSGEMVMCEFCHSGDGVEAQDMGEGRVMQLCVNCRVNIAENEERAAEFNRMRERERAEADAICDLADTRLKMLYGDAMVIVRAVASQSHAQTLILRTPVTGHAFWECQWCHAYAPRMGEVKHKRTCTWLRAGAVVDRDEQRVKRSGGDGA